jgi:peptidoglycan/xylan/chitin deacetylase (PgdA/CDA1 family)
MSQQMRPLSILGAAVAAFAAAHAAPALAAIGPLRRPLFPAVAGIGDAGHVALTFDDGPHPDATPELLRLLDGAGVHATFFVLGRMVDDHPEIARAIVAAGHEIGVHGYEHRLLLKRGPWSTRDDLTRAMHTITSVTGVIPRWWRPPYGAATTVALLEARRLGLRPVLWTCWGRDWTASCTADSVYRTVMRRLDSGGTILLHDSDHAAAPKCWLATLAVLPAVLTTCAARGLRVGPLREHGIPGGPPLGELRSRRHAARPGLT